MCDGEQEDSQLRRHITGDTGIYGSWLPACSGFIQIDESFLVFLGPKQEEHREGSEIE